MIASHDQITTMAAHVGLRVVITRKRDGKDRYTGSKYTFFDVGGEQIGEERTPKEAKAWLRGYGCASIER